MVGVNDDTFDPATHKVVSNASCTTNCFVPDGQGARRRLRRREGPHDHGPRLHRRPDPRRRPPQDLRRARAAAINIIPTSTGAARATGLVLESMKGKLDGTSLRVPVPDGSITDFIGVLSQEVTVDEVNEAFKAAADLRPAVQGARLHRRAHRLLRHRRLAGLVHVRLRSSPWPCGNLVKVLGWYDNEWGYSNRLVDLVEIVGAAK